MNTNFTRRSSRIYGKSTALTELMINVQFENSFFQSNNSVKSSVELHFRGPPYPTGMENDLIFIAILFMLKKHVYSRMTNGWTSIVPVMKLITGKSFRTEKEDVVYTALCPSIHLYDLGEKKIIPIHDIALLIYRAISIQKDKYQSHSLYGLAINVFSDSLNEDETVVIPTDNEVFHEIGKLRLLEEIPSSIIDKNSDEYMEDKKDKKYNPKLPDYITSLKNPNRKMMDEYLKKKEANPQYKGKPPLPSVIFAADMETIQLEADPRIQIDESVGTFPNQNKRKREKQKSPRHYAYAASWMAVKPDKKLSKADILHSFSHEYRFTDPDFYDQSERVLSSFIHSLVREGKKLRMTPIVYFHNLSKFDGFVVAEHLFTKHNDEYDVILQCRNNTIYEISVYKKNQFRGKQDSLKRKEKRLLLRFRCSLLILPDSLENLAKQICPELGGKEEMDHQSVTLDSLNEEEKYIQYRRYLSQDVFLLGVILQSVQKYYWDEFLIDISTKKTIASLSLGIFRMEYYDDIKHRMYVPNENADKFIRSAYFGGHSDVYKPKGENLYVYDVNSLYPSVMVGNKYPGGRPVWHSDLTEHKLEDIFGFVQALVKCDGINKPFLPSKHPVEDTLIFPEGTFFGTYFTEDLKYAKSIGYEVIITCGYLFDRMDSPFDAFVNALYKKRMKAKAAGNTVAAYICKLLLNSLYGRLAISTECDQTIVLNKEQTEAFVRQTPTKDVMVLTADINIISYIESMYDTKRKWKPPVNTCPQMSAAITGYSRIKMYPYISRDDCYYTDTDSVVLSNPLPEEEVSETELGKFKLEHGGVITIGYFVSPKCYLLRQTKKDNKFCEIVKFKGVPKGLVPPLFFDKMIKNIEHIDEVTYTNYFRVDYKFMTVNMRKSHVSLRMNSKKRKAVFDSNNQWIDTKPVQFDKNTMRAQLARSRNSEVLILSLLSRDKRLKKAFNGKKESPPSDDESDSDWDYCWWACCHESHFYSREVLSGS
uniref:DNA polymerase n=1 Tax=Lolium perenne TaxID=4522 RepID=B2RGD9_LOLPR|nr:unnamed protein product [Lolium perenne]